MIAVRVNYAHDAFSNGSKMLIAANKTTHFNKWIR